ncbi:hypothetical protein BGZ63DRAFT_426281 [Mariannaea sp. PMI_226]|nr:hypothetical protein BGZ63DRAFT_426281 [Mariannaea sp. PMI_226]
MSNSSSIKKSSLWSLPAQPLPEADSTADPVFVTIWLVVTAILTVLYHRLLKRGQIWPEFWTIMVGTAVLGFWYIVVVLDRWLHWHKDSVVYGYILIMPIWDTFYVLSTILILWGNYTIVFREFKPRRFTKKQKQWWWGVAYAFLFIVYLMSTFFVLLQFALSVVWMEFSSLNTIADVATKKRQFELTMNAFFFGFSLLTTGAASVAILWRTTKDEGSPRLTQIVLMAANLILLARSSAQFGIAIQKPNVSRNTTVFTGDITYGLLTCLYLIIGIWLARTLSSPEEIVTDDIELVRNDIRKAILDKLDEVTESHRIDSPEFASLIDDLLANNKRSLVRLLENGPLSANVALTHEQKMQAAEAYLDILREKYGALNPKVGLNWEEHSRASSAFSMKNLLPGQRSKQELRTPSNRSLRGSIHQSRSRDLSAMFTRQEPVLEEAVSQ